MAEISKVLWYCDPGLRQLTGGKRKSRRIWTMSLFVTPAFPLHARAESSVQWTCAFMANTLNGLQVIILNPLLMVLYVQKK